MMRTAQSMSAPNAPTSKLDSCSRRDHSVLAQRVRLDSTTTDIIPKPVSRHILSPALSSSQISAGVRNLTSIPFPFEQNSKEKRSHSKWEEFDGNAIYSSQATA